MKKCEKCGTVQDDSRFFCIDCGERLGSSMTDEEEASYLEKESKKTEELYERGEPFYVSVADKVLGVFALFAAAAMLFLIIAGEVRLQKTAEQYQTPDDAPPSFTSVGELFSQAADDKYSILVNTPGSVPYDLHRSSAFAIIALPPLLLSAAYLLIPKLFWRLESLGIRIRANIVDEDIAPSPLWLLAARILKYGLFALGMTAAAVAVWFFF